MQMNPLNNDSSFIKDFLTSLILCFGDNNSTKVFCEKIDSYPVKPEIKRYQAYRVLWLTLPEYSHEHSWKKDSLDHSKICGVLSWSKTIKSAEFYSKKHSEPSRIILLEGEINGFDLINYCQIIVNNYDGILIYQSYIDSLKRHIDLYKAEEELISLNVIHYFIIKDENHHSY